MWEWDMNGWPLWTSEPLLRHRFLVEGSGDQILLAFTNDLDDREAISQSQAPDSRRQGGDQP